MSLLDHFSIDSGENGINRLPSHQFTDTMFLWAIGDITKQQVIDAWSLTESPIEDADELQLDEIKANFVALSTKADEVEYINKVEAVFRLFEIGKLTEAQSKSLMGLI